MGTAASTLTLLETCGEPSEADVLRSLLEAHDISCVVQGEHHHRMLGTVWGGAVIELRVLVAGRDLERARALLSSELEIPHEQDSEESSCEDRAERETPSPQMPWGRRRKLAAWLALGFVHGFPAFLLGLLHRLLG
ncbi:DUF2007 domain-containing protein [Pyxidicoccus fallax]|uniref:DUF2007 domain-containing protein n=1 Tax=Pyxidicoccus fallax TaxID=394095 RepID=A0A848LSZ5_9BACT|nr:DUF2007 domain-containing protein [Pyxidicoccus fallax]NMO20742.1 DUF2007 domain-containing protein [Pyxidicoccus fallax]NPC81624.1 DUF2007 domain-containing protein [Pyxidicoccus fallax]